MAIFGYQFWPIFGPLFDQVLSRSWPGLKRSWPRGWPKWPLTAKTGQKVVKKGVPKWPKNGHVFEPKSGQKGVKIPPKPGFHACKAEISPIGVGERRCHFDPLLGQKWSDLGPLFGSLLATPESTAQEPLDLGAKTPPFGQTGPEGLKRGSQNGPKNGPKMGQK